MAHSRGEVFAVVQKTFPESAHARVLELLDDYGVESYERERERVQLAILKLSEGNEKSCATSWRWLSAIIATCFSGRRIQKKRDLIHRKSANE